MMAGIRGKNTKPELALRQALDACGFRYRLHAGAMPGRPDLFFPKFGAAIFIHGCFWHRHAGCRYATTPATRPEFWQSKFDSNVKRDRFVLSALLDGGWRAATVWECALRRPDQVAMAAKLLGIWLRSGGALLEIGNWTFSRSSRTGYEGL
jgi:DNA mismatch endonuclease (patch repair protein)